MPHNSPHQSRRKKYSPKVKSGCQTCKIRRVKCDEARPACQRCSRTGRKCDGYGNSTVNWESCGLADSALILVWKNASGYVTGNAREKRGFSYYLHNTAPSVSSYYDSLFGDKLLVQAAASEPMLGHAIIGIGALHEAFANKQPYSNLKSTKGQFAIAQYTKAIGHLRRSLAADTGAQQPLTMLMACILFACFESIQGHSEPTLVHLRGAFKILRQVRSKPGSDAYYTTRSLVPTLMRLSNQAVYYVDTIQHSDRQILAAELSGLVEWEDNIPERFCSLEEARDAFNYTFCGLSRVFLMLDPDLPYNAQGSVILLYDRYIKRLDIWNKAYERFMQVNIEKLNSREVRGSACLKAQHIMANIGTKSGQPSMDDSRPLGEVLLDGSRFIPYTNDFKAILNLSESLIAASEADIKIGKTPQNFSTDMGIVCPIFYSCIKCADSAIRVAAVALLRRCPRREGMWDSAALLELVQKTWASKLPHSLLQETWRNLIAIEEGE